MFGFKILIDGDYACFTRPEFKVERVTYDVPCPGALEGLLKSVYWKPQIKYCIDKIIVFNPIRFLDVRRNEVKDKISYYNVKKKMQDPKVDLSIYTNESRHQRASIVLKNVRYGIQFHFEITGIKNEMENDSEKKHYNILKRRLENGQQFRTPCLGCSEFPVKSIKLVDSFDISQIDPEILSKGDVDLGYMVHHVQFDDGGQPLNGDWDHPQFSDKATAVYYRPHMIEGIIDVTHYAEDLKC